MNNEDFILKKIRHFQGTVADYATYWETKIAEGKSQESAETKSLKAKNDDLNKDFRIIPVKRED